MIDGETYVVEERGFHSSSMCCCGEWFHTGIKGTVWERMWAYVHKGHALYCGWKWAFPQWTSTGIDFGDLADNTQNPSKAAHEASD